MWAAPRKATLPMSPLSARALLCADHKANHFSAVIRRLAVPFFAVSGPRQSVKSSENEVALSSPCSSHGFSCATLLLAGFQRGSL